MTFREFMFWLDGYEEGFVNGTPDPFQWAKIKERLEQVKEVRQYIPPSPLIPDLPKPQRPSGWKTTY